jgi:hypothetical protein
MPPGRHSAGIQSAWVIPGGRRKRAIFWLDVRSESFFSPDWDSPATCTLRIVATQVGGDRTPENNVVELKLEVLDYNDF